MHLPGHMMPFSQSLANQGMQQTNDNINSMNMQNSPEQNINQAPTFDYTNFVGGSMNLGMQPYQSSGNAMPNSNLIDFMTEPESELPDFNQPIFPNFSNIMPGGFDFGLQPYNPNSPYEEEEIEQFQENIANILATSQAPQFTGGGGQGGQAARQLYFPGTSGGFSSVGTGIGGGGTTLDDLLRRMR